MESNVNEIFVAIGMTLAILASVAAPVVVLLRLMRHQTRQKEQRYRFLLELADRQQTLPPELLLEPKSTDADRRRGLVLVSGGLGLFLTLVALPLEYDEGHRLSELWGVACLPLMVGLGYLVSWWLGERDARAGG